MLSEHKSPSSRRTSFSSAAPSNSPLTAQPEINHPEQALKNVQTLPFGVVSSKDILALQRTIGNHALQRLLQPQPITPIPPIRQRIQRSGLDSADALISYAQTIQGTAKADFRAFGTALIEYVNRQLEAMHIPRVFSSWQNLADTTRGAFHRVNWTIELNKALAYTKQADFDDLASTIYHEARHCEQNFKILQLLAYNGLDVAAMQRVTGSAMMLSSGTCEAAIAHKNDVKKWSEGLVAMVKGWYGGMFDATFDQAVQNHSTMAGSQTTRVDDREELKGLTAKITKLVSTPSNFLAALNDLPADPTNGTLTQALVEGGNLVQHGLPALVQQFITAVRTPEQNAGDLASVILQKLKSLLAEADQAYHEYAAAAHEADSFGIQAKLTAALKAVRDETKAPPPLPAPLADLSAWKQAITIKVTIGTSSGGKNIKKVTNALEAVIKAHTNFGKSHSLISLTKALLKLIRAADEWLKLKATSTKDTSAQRAIPMKALRDAASTYLGQIG